MDIDRCEGWIYIGVRDGYIWVGGMDLDRGEGWIQWV